MMLERGRECPLELGPRHDLGCEPLRELVLGGRTDGSLGKRPREDLVERLFRARLEPPSRPLLSLAALPFELTARAPEDGADQRCARDHAHREDDDAARCRSRPRAGDQQSEGHVARLGHIGHAPSLPAGPAMHNTRRSRTRQSISLRVIAVIATRHMIRPKATRNARLATSFQPSQPKAA
jgi:hypothetical protein